MKANTALLLAALCVTGLVSCSTDEPGPDGGERCAAGLISCNDLCVSTASDPRNCGSCARTCDADQVCSDGLCQGSCPEKKRACGGACVDTSSDPDHCGACAHACGEGQFCVSGACLAQCPANTEHCGNTCADLSASAEHCGSCGHACLTPGATGTCRSGQCEDWACLPGRADQNGDPSDGCEGACSAKALMTSGQLDFDLQTVQISGRVTLEGADPGAASGASRGTLSFARAGSKIPVTVSLPATGAATYQVRLIAGTYAIELVNGAGCPRGTLPCGTTPLRKGLTLQADGALDLDVAAAVAPFDVTGQVTVNGSAMAASPTGKPRGSLTFRPTGGGSAVSTTLGASGAASYRVTLSAGTYDVELKGESDCDSSNRALPCQRRVLRKGLALQTTGGLDFNVNVVRVSGSVTVNGGPMAGSATGTERGQLTLHDEDGSVAVGLGRSGDASYSLQLMAGTYDVAVSNATDCPGSSSLPPVPCQKHTLKEGVALSAPGSLDFDLKTALLTGTVSVNGATMAQSATGKERGKLLFSDAEGAVAAGVGASGAASFRALLFRGTYAVSFTNTLDCPTDGSGATPCQSWSLNPSLSVQAGGAADYDLPVIELQGQLTVNGTGTPASRGLLAFAGSPETGTAQADLSRGATAAYHAKLYPGHYAVILDNSACQDSALPCQKAALRKLDLTTGGKLDFDAKVASISGVVTLNGAAMPASPNGRPRGRVGFTDTDGGEASAEIGAGGAASYQVKVLAGRYGVSFTNDTDCFGGAVPCGSKKLWTDVNIAANAALDLDLQVITVTGRVTVNGQPMPSSVTGGARGTLQFLPEEKGAPVEPSLGTAGPAIFSARTFAGGYGVVFVGKDCPPQAPGATPCQDALLAGCGD